MNGNGKNVISAKISDETLSAMDETMAYLGIETRQELIKRAIVLFLSTFRFACDKNAICKPLSGYPDGKSLFTADSDKKTVRVEQEHGKLPKSRTLGTCADCGIESFAVREVQMIHNKKWLCPECAKKYPDRSR